MSLLSFWSSDWKKYEEEVKEAYQMGFADGRLCPQGRSCEVDGKPATFHRWAEEDKTLLQMESHIPPDKFELIRYRFDKESVAPAFTSIKTVRHTFALVEFPDGTVRKVEPEDVKFTERRAE